jgi:hypothetical protein
VVNEELEKVGISTGLVERGLKELVEKGLVDLVGPWDSINEELTSEDFSFKTTGFWGIGAIPWLKTVRFGVMGLGSFFGELLVAVWVLS